MQGKCNNQDDKKILLLKDVPSSAIYVMAFLRHKRHLTSVMLLVLFFLVTDTVNCQVSDTVAGNTSRPGFVQF